MDDVTIELRSSDRHADIQDKNQQHDYWETGSPDHVSNDLNNALLTLAIKHDVPLKKIQTLLRLPPLSSSQALICHHCHACYHAKNNKHYKTDNNRTHWVCPACKNSLLKGEAQKTHTLLTQRFHQALQEAPQPEDLGFMDALFLIAIINNSHNEVGSEIPPHLLADSPLAPTRELNGMMYAHLLRKNIIAVSPESHLSFIEYSEEGGDDGCDTLYYQWDHVSWLITAQGYSHDLAEVIASCYAHLVNRKWSGRDFDEVQLMCETVWVNEALCYIRYLGKRHYFDITEDHYLALSSILIELLHKFPLTKINVLLWRSAKFAQWFYVNKGGDPLATNRAFINRLKINSNKALRDDGTIDGEGFERQSSVVGSTVSSLLFNDILHEKEFGHYKLLEEII